MAGSQNLAVSSPQPRKRPKLQYQPASLEHFLRFMAPDDGVRQATAMHRHTGDQEHEFLRLNKGGLELAGHMLAEMSRIAFLMQQDLYLCPHAFKKWRCTGDLKRLSAWYVEIDTQDHQAGLDADLIEKQVLRAVRKADLPAPQAIVRSGSGGCHLYWFTSLEITKDNKRRAVRGWKAVAHWLTDSIEAHKPKSARWKVDAGASHDPVRMLRLPGSMHACGVKASASVLTDRAAWRRYSFWDLVALAPAHEVAPVQQNLFVADVPTQHDNSLDRETGQPKPKSKRHTYGQWQGRLYWHLVRYARTEGVKHSQRDMLLHIALSALLQLNPGDPDKAYNEIRLLNEQHVGLSDREFTQYMATTRRTKYRYGLKTANARLVAVGIPPLASNAKQSTLTADEIRAKQQLGAQIAATNKRNSSLQALIDLLTQRAAITQAEAAEALGKSLRTIKTYWKEALDAVEPAQAGPEVEGAVSSPSIYPPLTVHPNGAPIDHMAPLPALPGLYPPGPLLELDLLALDPG